MTAVANADTGLQFAKDKQYNEAIQEFNSLLLQDQTSADVYFYRGCAHLHLGQYGKAIDDFSSAIPSSKLADKYELPAFYKRAFAYCKTNQIDSALDDCGYYITLCKENQAQKHLLHKGLFQMGIIYVALNENNSAVSYFTDAIAKSEHSEEDRQKLYYLHRGRAFACLTKYDQAQNDLHLVLEQSNDPFVKGCAYSELGQHEKALQEFNSLALSHEDKSKLVQGYNDHILFRQGLSYASLSLHDQALEHFQSALEQSKQQKSSDITDRILFRKGITNMELNRAHRALVDFQESAQLNDNQPDVFYARAMIHYKLGRLDAAVYDQRRAMELERKSPSSAPQLHQQIDIYNYYENKRNAANKLLEKYTGTRIEPDIHYGNAISSQKQAPYSGDSRECYKTARRDILRAKESRCESPVKQSVAITINSFLAACDLLEKYSNRTMPDNAVEEYIDYSVEIILRISQLFDQCVQKQQEWNELSSILQKEMSAVNKERSGKFHAPFQRFMDSQIERMVTIQKAKELFPDSSAQQEFYGLLLIRLGNFFDGIRLASTGIFSNQLEGTFGKVSLAFKQLGKLFQFLHVGSKHSERVFGVCVSGLKKIDEIRIENTLTQIGRQCDPAIVSQMAKTIAKEITEIYEDQIKRFPTTSEENSADDTHNQQQQPPTVCAKCADCLSQCCRCLNRHKNRIMNNVSLSTMKKIVEYGYSLVLSCLVRFEAKNATKTECIENIFINGVCRPSKITVFHTMGFAEKITPKGGAEPWNTYDFFRRPAIRFEGGTKHGRKETDLAKFGCRKPTKEEKHLYETDPQGLDKLGFKTIASE